MQEDSLGEALRVPPSNKFIKNKRNYFVKGGSMFEIRLRMRMKNHQHSLVSQGSKHARCIICCEHCIKGTQPDHHTRVGMQTKCACSYCSLALHQQLNQGKLEVVTSIMSLEIILAGRYFMNVKIFHHTNV